MPFIPVHLGRRVVTWARVSPEDAHLARHRWRLTTGGYAVRGVETIAMHRDILDLQGFDPRDQSRVTDHINGTRLDNRRSNLRVITQAQNAQNVAARGGSSKFIGVCWDRKSSKWKARVEVGGRVHNLGLYSSEVEAAAVVRACRAAHMPFSREARLHEELAA